MVSAELSSSAAWDTSNGPRVRYTLIFSWTTDPARTHDIVARLTLFLSRAGEPFVVPAVRAKIR
jgi:hypothetical protein